MAHLPPDLKKPPGAITLRETSGGDVFIKRREMAMGCGLGCLPVVVILGFLLPAAWDGGGAFITFALMGLVVGLLIIYQAFFVWQELTLGSAELKLLRVNWPKRTPDSINRHDLTQVDIRRDPNASVEDGKEDKRPLQLLLYNGDTAMISWSFASNELNEAAWLGQIIAAWARAPFALRDGL